MDKIIFLSIFLLFLSTQVKADSQCPDNNPYCPTKNAQISSKDPSLPAVAASQSTDPKRALDQPNLDNFLKLQKATNDLLNKTN